MCRLLSGNELPSMTLSVQWCQPFSSSFQTTAKLVEAKDLISFNFIYHQAKNHEFETGGLYMYFTSSKSENVYWNLCLLVKINGMSNIVWCDYWQLSALYLEMGTHKEKKIIPKQTFNQSLYSCFKSKWWVMVRTMNPLCKINTDHLVF